MIRKLPQEVINKIAAGEVIQRPYNVIKELVQNAIDAQATHIKIFIIAGGMESIEVIDNGKGIKREDFDLLCQRFATSKISDLRDLETISSFGFRGQALASLSYVSELQIQSKHKSQNVGYRCTYRDQKMIEQPELISINTGTKIKATKLFNTLQTRRASLNPGQQKKKVIRLVSHLALHYNTIKFQVQSQKGQQFSSDTKGLPHSSSKMKIFQLITKQSYDKFIYLPKQMLDQIKIQGIITKLNTIKSKTLLLNVNNRIVQNQEIVKIVQRSYSQCYQSIHQENQGFFVYLSIEIEPRKIDCNQHPSKKVIAFFGADKIYDNLYKWVITHIKEESSIKSVATNIASKGNNPFNATKNMVLNFKSQATMSQGIGQTQKMVNEKEDIMLKPDKMVQSGVGVVLKEKQKPLYDFQRNRTDSLQMPINFYIKQKETSQSKHKQLKYAIKVDQKDKQLSQNIKKFFQHVTYVGCFNLHHIFIQLDTILYSMNIIPCLESFVREWLQENRLIIHEIVQKSAWMDLRTIIEAFLRNKKLEGKVNIDAIVDKILVNKYLLAKEYGIVIQEDKSHADGAVSGFPVFQKFMADCLSQDQLAYFLCRLFAKEPSNLQCEAYFVEFLISLFQADNNQSVDVPIRQGKKEQQLSPMNGIYSQYFRDKVIPTLKTRGKDHKNINFTDNLSQMVNLKDIYKIFERC